MIRLVYNYRPKDDTSIIIILKQLLILSYLKAPLFGLLIEREDYWVEIIWSVVSMAKQKKVNRHTRIQYKELI